MRSFVLTLAVASAAFGSVPASAQTWHLQPRIQTQIRADINQLQNQIQRAAQRRTISQREAVTLRRQSVDLRQLLARFSRNGLSRPEVTALEQRINRVRQNLRLERRDWDGRRG
jgi:predicted RNase H-like nuclease (RuvC/YqgF family)